MKKAKTAWHVILNVKQSHHQHAVDLAIPILGATAAVTVNTVCDNDTKTHTAPIAADTSPIVCRDVWRCVIPSATLAATLIAGPSSLVRPQSSGISSASSSTLSAGAPITPTASLISSVSSHNTNTSASDTEMKQTHGGASYGASHVTRSDSTPDWSIAWIDICDLKFFNSLQIHQRVNQLPGIEHITRKSTLASLLMNASQSPVPLMASYTLATSSTPAAAVSYETKSVLLDYSFVPLSFTLPVDYAALTSLLTSSVSTSSPSSHASTGISDPGSAGEARTWIVKPHAMARGNGIYLTMDPLKSVTSSDRVVIQHYIDKPMLINNRKFDLRLYVLITSVLPLHIYLYDDGLARFCAEPYQPPHTDNLTAICGHLTNYSVNKDSHKFIAPSSTTDRTNDDHDNGFDIDNDGSAASKWTLTSFKEYLVRHGHDVGTLWKRIGDLIVATIWSSYDKLKAAYKVGFPHDIHGGAGFQLLGFDVLIDHTLKPWICEVNRSPSLKCDTELDRNLKTTMVATILRMMDPSAFQATSAEKHEEADARRRMKFSEFKVWKDTHRRHGVMRRVAHEESVGCAPKLFTRLWPPAV